MFIRSAAYLAHVAVRANIKLAESIRTTSLTACRESWLKLAQIHKSHSRSTKVVYFETTSSPLGSSSYVRELGGGYCYVTFDL